LKKLLINQTNLKNNLNLSEKNVQIFKNLKKPKLWAFSDFMVFIKILLLLSALVFVYNTQITRQYRDSK